jgi:hypothetical protein
MVDRLIWALAERKAINVKEVLESFETFARVRRRLRAKSMADLCCGHGLTGLIFAALEPKVEAVTLYDREKPPKADVILEAIVEVAPWVEAKITWVEADVDHAAEHLPPRTSIVAVHACGVRTDRVLEAALAVGGDVAVVPCCYAKTNRKAPRPLREVLGAELATDVHRTYWLEHQGYKTEWATIPEAISEKNRILIGLRKEEGLASSPKEISLRRPSR